MFEKAQCCGQGTLKFLIPVGKNPSTWEPVFGVLNEGLNLNVIQQGNASVAGFIGLNENIH